MKASNPSRRSKRLSQDTKIEMLYAAAEAHPNWEVISEGIRHVGSEGPDTPEKLLEWFLKKGRH
jgi:hypothetical protein